VDASPFETRFVLARTVLNDSNSLSEIRVEWIPFLWQVSASIVMISSGSLSRIRSSGAACTAPLNVLGSSLTVRQLTSSLKVITNPSVNTKQLDCSTISFGLNPGATSLSFLRNTSRFTSTFFLLLCGSANL
jgi:hypothetical protein